MSLLDKATIITTPTAYGNGVLHSVKGGSVADFDVVRGSAATRVNAEGLIEDISVLSGELIANGGFSNQSDWTLQANASIGNNELTLNGSSNTVYALQNLYSSGLYNGKTLRFTYEIISNTLVGGGNFRGGGITGGSLFPSANLELNSTVGIHTVDIVINSTGVNSALDIFITSLYTSGSLVIDNISVKEVIDATNIPRIDYTDGTASILLEPQSTNLVTYSESLTQWANTLYTLVESNSTISPDGSVNADKLVAGATNGLQLRIAPLSLTSGNTYTFSTYVKNSGGNYVILYMNDSDSQGIKVDLVNETFVTMGSSTNHFIKNFGNGWYQIGFTRAIDANVSGLNAVPSLDRNNVSFLGDGVNGVYVWGTQVEEQSFATSYIPTNGAISTRLQDTAFGAGSSDLINSTEGVLYAEISALANGGVGDRYISLGGGSSQNTIQLLFHNTANRVNFRLTKAGSLEVNISDFTFLQTDDLKIACKFKENDFALWINGVERVVETIGETFSVNTLQEIQFDSGTGASNFYGKCKTVAVFKEALTDAELTCLTTI